MSSILKMYVLSCIKHKLILAFGGKFINLWFETMNVFSRARRNFVYCGIRCARWTFFVGLVSQKLHVNFQPNTRTLNGIHSRPRSSRSKNLSICMKKIASFSKQLLKVQPCPTNFERFLAELSSYFHFGVGWIFDPGMDSYGQNSAKVCS